MALTGTIRRTVDLDKGIKCDHFERLFATSDDEAHTFEITVTASGNPVDLTGAGVMGYFIRKDQKTVAFKGSAKSNVATVKLAESCYVDPRYFSFIIKASYSGKPVAIYWADGTVTRASTDTIVDPGHEIYSLEELLAHIAEMESATSAATSAAKTANDAAGKANTATNAANTAASAANTAASAANTAKTNADAATKKANDAASSATSAASSATTAAGSANTAADAANTAASAATTAKTNADAATKKANDAATSATNAASAANTAKTNADAATKKANDAATAATTATTNANAATTKANAAAGLIENMTATAKKVASGGNPSVDVTRETNPDRLNLAFGLVTGNTGAKGDKGDTGAAAGFGTITATVDNKVGTPSVDVTATGANTAKNITFNFHNLKGIPGEGAVSTVWGAQPDDAGDVKPEVGGTNLLLNSKQISVTRKNTANNWIAEKHPFFKSSSYGEAKIVTGKQVILSFDYDINNITTPKKLLLGMKNTPTSYNNAFSPAIPVSVGNNSGHYVGYLTITDNAEYDKWILFSGFGVNENEGAVITVYNAKLELGDVPTGWLPAPEDLYSADNPPPYPVTSVNGKTGAVTITPSSIGAASESSLASYLPLAGGTMTGPITTRIGSAWKEGWDKAPLKNTFSSNASFVPIAAVKTINGKWVIGRDPQNENLDFCYWLDTNKTNSPNKKIYFTEDGTTTAVPSYPVTSVNGETGAVTITDITGNAGTATKLATPRTFPAVDLGSTAESKFDGSKNPTALGISGTLPITHGGTGSTTASGGLSNLGGVPTSRKVNGKPLSSDITLSASDVKARPSTWTPSLSDLGAQAALGFTPVQQGGGTDQGTNKVYIGWDGATGRLKAQVDSTDLGGIWVDSKPVIDPEGTTATGWVGGKWNLIDIFNLCKRGMWIGQTKSDTWVNDDLPSGANAYGTLQMWHPYSGKWNENYPCAIYIDRENHFYFGTGNYDTGRFNWSYLASPTPIPVTSVNGQTGAVQLDASSVGARPASWTPTPAEIGAPKFTQVWNSALSAGANFPSQTLSCPGMAGHACGFVLFGLKAFTLPYYVQWFWYGQTALWGKRYINDGGSDIVSRRMTPNFDNSTIVFGSGYASGVQDDTYCVPISIYVCSL